MGRGPGRRAGGARVRAARPAWPRPPRRPRAPVPSSRRGFAESARPPRVPRRAAPGWPPGGPRWRARAGPAPGHRSSTPSPIRQRAPRATEWAASSEPVRGHGRTPPPARAAARSSSTVAQPIATNRPGVRARLADRALAARNAESRFAGVGAVTPAAGPDGVADPFESESLVEPDRGAGCRRTRRGRSTRCPPRPRPGWRPP